MKRPIICIYKFMPRTSYSIEHCTYKRLSILEDINDVNATYRDTILKGANGQFIDLPYGLINPKQRVTVEQLMTLLKNIDR